MSEKNGQKGISAFDIRNSLRGAYRGLKWGLQWQALFFMILL